MTLPGCAQTRPDSWIGTYHFDANLGESGDLSISREMELKISKKGKKIRAQFSLSGYQVDDRWEGPITCAIKGDGTQITVIYLGGLGGDPNQPPLLKRGSVLFKLEWITQGTGKKLVTHFKNPDLAEGSKALHGKCFAKVS